MKRKIIKIDKDKCNGCELCVKACHESAIGIVDGKASLLRDDYCDGLGDCLPVCPTNAITFEEREALEYNEAEVKKNMEIKKSSESDKLPCGCPGTNSRSLKKVKESSCKSEFKENESNLLQWPVQIKLVPTNAEYFDNADLLIAADCTAYAYSNFHDKFMKNKVTVIGCPKLDDINYAEKLTSIIKNNNINSITVVRMQVPCCGGIVNAVVEALKNSGKIIQWQVVTLSVDGKII